MSFLTKYLTKDVDLIKPFPALYQKDLHQSSLIQVRCCCTRFVRFTMMSDAENSSDSSIEVNITPTKRYRMTYKHRNKKVPDVTKVEELRDFIREEA